MDIEQRSPSDIKPYEKNPRINDAAVDAVAESIRLFGFRQPIVVDTEGVIVCGQTRWKAARKLGLEKVPVHVATDLTPVQIRAYRIADNKTNELAEWDFNLLPIELAEVSAQDDGIDWSLLGFDKGELAKLLGSEGLTDPDDAPDVEVGESFQIVAECKSEEDQQELYGRLTKEGYECRVLTL